MITPTAQTVTTAAASTTNWFAAFFSMVGAILSAPITGLIRAVSGNKKVQAEADQVLKSAEALAPAAATILAATGNPSAAAAITTADTLAKSVQASHASLLTAIAQGAAPAVLTAMADQHKGKVQAALASVNAVAKALDTATDVQPGA